VPVTVQYVLLWASGVPNSRPAPGSPHSSYTTVHTITFYHDLSYCDKLWSEVRQRFDKLTFRFLPKWLSTSRRYHFLVGIISDLQNGKLYFRPMWSNSRHDSTFNW